MADESESDDPKDKRLRTVLDERHRWNVRAAEADAPLSPEQALSTLPGVVRQLTAESASCREVSKALLGHGLKSYETGPQHVSRNSFPQWVR